MPVDPRVKFLRQNETHTERLLWAQLRKKRVGDMRFRRQYPLGPYIVDFVCLPARLIIEVDGPSHDSTAENDERRAAWLLNQKFRVIRFSNRDILTNLEGAVRTIEVEIAGAGPGM
ncbi:MAG: endonuclease domain-containing protein [Alphaproteobacteria bacterium]